MADRQGQSISDKDNPPQVGERKEVASHLTLTHVYNIGIKLEHLRKSLEEPDENPNVSDIIFTLDRIESILSGTHPNKEATRLVRENVSDLRELDQALLPDKKVEHLETQITSCIHLFGRILSEETRIPASNLGIIDVHKLSESPEDLFDVKVWDWLEERPKSDIKEACRSVAVDCSTASVMLSLRAVEHCLRQWYEHENEELDVTTWGAVLDQLMEEYTDEEKKNDTVLTQMSDLPPVLTSLYYLKEKRNEVSHPDGSPSSREARRTLIVVASTISEIYGEIGPDEDDYTTSPSVDTPEKSLREFGESSEKGPPENAILDLIHNLDHGEGAHRGEVIEEYLEMESSATRDEIEDTIQDLLMSGKVYEPGKGILRPI